MSVGVISRIEATNPQAPAVLHPPRKSLDALTGVRFFAAMGVVLFHFSVPVLQTRSYFLANIAREGFVAVDLFYVLSGFILAYTYLNRDGNMTGTLRNFYVSRFARLYPAYLVAFLLAAQPDIVTSLHVNRLPAAVAKLSVNAVAVLLMQQSWTPWTAWAWNYPAWSVSVEVFFYLVFPWLAVRLARCKGTTALVVGVLLWIAGLIPPLLLWILKGVSGEPTQQNHLQMAIEFTPILRVHEFAIGVLLGRAYSLGKFNRLNGNLLACVAAIGIFAVLGLCPGLPHPLVANGLLAPLFAALIVGLSRQQGPLAWFLSLPFMVVLGEASYGIYILQIPLALAIKQPPPHHSVPMLCFYCGLLVLASVLTWRFVEVPLRRWIRLRLSA